MNEYLKYIPPFVISILSGVLSHYIMSLKVIYGVLLSIIVFLILIIIVLYTSYLPTSFLKKVYPQRGALEKKEELKLISEAKKSVKVLGISHRSFWAANGDFLKSLIKAGHKKDVKITFLILDPEGENLKPKAEDEGANQNHWKSEIKISIDKFKKLKQDYPIINLELYTYDIFSIWHMVIIDDETGLIGYYPTGESGSSSPLYLITKSDLSLLTPFIKCFNTIKSGGNRIISKGD